MNVGTGAVAIGQLGWEFPYRLLRGDFVPWATIWAFITAKGFAAALACCVPLSLWIAIKEPGSWRAAAVCAALLQIGLTITTANKSAWGGFLAMILAVGISMAFRGNRKTLIAWAFGGIAATTVILTLVYELPDEPPAPAVWDWMPPQLVDTHRQQIWHFTAEKIAEAPWLGYGMNSIDRVPGAKKILPGYVVEALPSHPHNWMLEILGETGVVGFVPVLIAVFWLAGRCLLRFVRNRNVNALAQLGLSAVFWGSSLFNFSIWSTWWLVTYFLFMAAIGANGPERDAEDRR